MNQRSLQTPGACFSKVPKRFGRISGDIILFVFSKRRHLEARKKFAVILIFIPFTTYEKTRGLFLESPETFRAHFGSTNSICIFKTKAFGGTKFCSYFNFYCLYNI